MNFLPAFRLQLLGSGSLARANGTLLSGRAGQRHRLALLTLLARAPAQTAQRDKLMALLWPDSDAERARNSLNVSVYVLRQTLGEDAIVSVGDELRLNTNRVAADVVEFDTALAHNDYETAVSLYRGPLLDAFFLNDAPGFEEWLESERTVVAAAYAKSVEALAEAAERENDLVGAVEWWKKRAAYDPYDSRVALRLITALDAAGNLAGALQQAATHTRLLQQEFGVEPPAQFISNVETIRSRPKLVRPALSASSRVVLPETSAAETSNVSSATHTKFAGATLYGAGAVLLLALIFVATRFGGERAGASPPSSNQPSIAVLPLTNLSNDPRDAPLADGMTEELTAMLSRSGNLRVIASTSAFHFKNRSLDIRTIADSLRVTNVLEGGFQKIGSKLRVQVRLIDASDGSTRWSSTYDRELQDVFSVQDEIAQSVARELTHQFAANQITPIRARHTQNLAAYELYLRGSDPTLMRNDSTAHAALQYFKRATELDPNYAAAYAGLARYTLRARNGIRPSRETLRVAEAAARKAVALDDSLGEAHTALGSVYLARYDFANAEKEYQRALEVHPYARTREFLARLYVWTRRPDAALQQVQIMVQNDPMSPIATAELAEALMANGRCDEALAQLQRIADVQPPLLRAGSITAQCYVQKQMWNEALARVNAAAAQTGAFGQAMRGYVLARAGQRDRALEIRDSLFASWRRGNSTAFHLAVVNSGLKDFDQTFLWLDRSIDDVSLTHLVMGPLFADVRGDPRFERLYNRLVVR